MKVPRYLRPTAKAWASATETTIFNSASKSYGGAVGGSMVWDKGYFGARWTPSTATMAPSPKKT